MLSFKELAKTELLFSGLTMQQEEYRKI